MQEANYALKGSKFNMKIFVIIRETYTDSGDGRTITLEEINPWDSIWDVKTKIEYWTGIHPGLQVLYFGGQVLGDDRTLADLVKAHNTGFAASNNSIAKHLNLTLYVRT